MFIINWDTTQNSITCYCFSLVIIGRLALLLTKLANLRSLANLRLLKDDIIKILHMDPYLLVLAVEQSWTQVLGNALITVFP